MKFWIYYYFSLVQLMIGSNPLGNETFTKWNGPSTLQQVVVDYANISVSAIWPDSEIQELNLRGNPLSKVPLLPKSLIRLDLSNTKLRYESFFQIQPL